MAKKRLKKCPNGQLMAISQGHPKPAFSEKVQREDKGKFFKNHRKRSPRLKGANAQAQIALSSNQYALKVQRLEKILGAKSGSKSARMANFWQFSKGHPKPAFSENVQSGDQDKFLKDRPKSSPRLKALWRKWEYSLISMHLKCKDWRRLWNKKAAQKFNNCIVMAIFARSPKTRIF